VTVNLARDCNPVFRFRSSPFGAAIQFFGKGRLARPCAICPADAGNPLVLSVRPNLLTEPLDDPSPRSAVSLMHLDTRPARLVALAERPWRQRRGHPAA